MCARMTRPKLAVNRLIDRGCVKKNLWPNRGKKASPQLSGPPQRNQIRYLKLALHKTPWLTDRGCVKKPLTQQREKSISSIIRSSHISNVPYISIQLFYHAY